MIDICDALVILNVKYQTSLVRSTSTFAARRTDAGARRRHRFEVVAPAIKDRLVAQAVVRLLAAACRLVPVEAEERKGVWQTCFKRARCRLRCAA